ncbi:hypothetical protein CLI92_07685 [Vandammella animalimorsus]|uniref:Tetratricopeptide repeat protein n=2 Tax=Vandammella animalimorsus TaxID=2029117 RepID=A0A2A2T523_9BURK|nr:tetratricopeptide repeat protein [Vandammella animalimorsus]PAT32263.1 hypothetical protein CK626_06180 [Vandammella animalimorsus]PAX16612.1 hypothetical protein CLI92_07685 [Vandammella animalimorsus]PAX19242.1 hypothetical protein CLI93_08705 [Vandammella animalimorsus]
MQNISGWDWRAIQDAAWSGDAGALKRPVSMLTFALNHAVSGMAPWPMKLSNLVIHLLAGMGFYVYALALAGVLARRDVGTASSATCSRHWARPLALLAVALWLLHPLQLTSVLYVVQRMASLAALFMAWGLALYALGRQRQVQGHAGWGAWLMIASAWGVFLPLAALSKENGVLLSPLLLLTEWLFFRWQGLAPKGRRALQGLHLTLCVLPALAVLAYLALHPQWILGSYRIRDFTWEERLYTQARVLWFYLRLLALPDIRQMGLYHDDFEISRSLWAPWSTLPAIIGLLMLVWLAWRLRRHWPVLAFAVFFFLIGHALESSVLGLEMVHEHRNYLPSFGLAFAVAYGAGLAWQRGQAVRRRRLAAACTLALLCLTALTAWRAVEWSDDLRRALMEAEHHPRSVRALTDVAALLGTRALHAPDESSQRQLLQATLDFYARADAVRGTPQSAVGQLVAHNRLGRDSDPQAVTQVAQLLATPPLAAATPEVIVSLMQCQHRGHCRFEMDVILELAHGLLANPQIRPIDQARVNTMLGQLFIDRDDLPTAAAFLQEAYRADAQNLTIALNFAVILADLGMQDEAQTVLNEMTGASLSRSQVRRMNELRARLSPSDSLR